MSEGFEQLKALGVQKIHEETHISRKNIEGIFNKSFEGMNPVQFAGFVSILEREYGFDLTELKRDFMSYWDGTCDTELPESQVEVPEIGETKSSKGWLLVGAILLIGFVVVMWQGGEPAAPAQETAVAQEPLPQTPSDLTVVETPVEAVEIEAVEEPMVVPTLSIAPKTKLWMGFIDLETYIREQHLTSDAVSLDTNRSWLMIFGHGHFKVEKDGEVLDFSSDNRLRFIYEDGTLREISRLEFKERNRGENW